VYQVKAFIALMAGLQLLAPQAILAQPAKVPGTVFALLDSNEWCPGGSVYIDLTTGSFMLYPRVAQPACASGGANLSVERGVLASADLLRLGAAYSDAQRAGLRRSSCERVVSNGGPQAVVITTPGYSAVTPEERGCWSSEAVRLYDELFKDFGEKRRTR
jgi:hypothetical protein